MQTVGVPSLRPLVSVLVDGGQKEMVEQPQMRWGIRIQPGCSLKLQKKILPLDAETARDIIPQPFDTGVVDGPMKRIHIDSLKTLV